MSARLPTALAFARSELACEQRAFEYAGLSLRQGFERLRDNPTHSDARWAMHKLGAMTIPLSECDCRFAEVFFESATFEMVLEALRAAGRLP